MAGPTQSQRDAYMITVTDLIAEHGWMVQGVFGTEPGEMFAYTVGLTEVGHPELLIRGLSLDICQSVLNTLALLVLAPERRTLHDGERISECLETYDVLIHGPIAPKDAEMNVALNLYGQVDALQVLWPDAEGTFPPDPSYDARFAAAQPVSPKIGA